jgi:hypothetical protein
LGGEFGNGDTVFVDAADGKLVFGSEARGAVAGASAGASAADNSADDSDVDLSVLH